MLSNRLALRVTCILFALVWAGVASAQKTYFLGLGSGGQLQIGGGLPLPPQLTDADLNGIRDWGASPTTGIKATALQPPPATTGGPGAGVFPPLLIPPLPGATVMDTAPGGALIIPAGVLSRPAAQNTLGQGNNNPNLYAVATNLGYKWPDVGVTLSARTTTVTAGLAKVTFPLNTVTVYKATTAGAGGKVKYRNPGKAAFFGGKARLTLSPKTGTTPPAFPVTCAGPTAVCGPILPSVGVTLFAIGPNSAPPCAGVGCNALLLKAVIGGPQAAGGAPLTPVTTPGGAVAGMNIYNIVAGATPKGTISAINGPVASGPPAANTAVSAGFPWTTGRLTVSAPGAAGAPERWVLSGADLRTPGGAGTIQLVSGAVSIRPAPAAGGTGPNANRAWVRLVLANPTQVPTMSNLGLMLLTSSLLGIGLFVGIRRSRRAEAA
jgi:hypothetical protein